GPRGSLVKLLLEREGVADPFEINVVRGSVEREVVLGSRRKVDDNFEFMHDPDCHIGYIRLTEFHRKTIRDLKRALADLEKQKMKGLILDLRFNAGGLLTKGFEVAELFIEQ